MDRDLFEPVTPGEMLQEAFLAEFGLSQNALAKAIGISPNRIAEIVHNRRRITADKREFCTRAHNSAGRGDAMRRPPLAGHTAHHNIGDGTDLDVLEHPLHDGASSLSTSSAHHIVVGVALDWSESTRGGE